MKYLLFLATMVLGSNAAAVTPAAPTGVQELSSSCYTIHEKLLTSVPGAYDPVRGIPNKTTSVVDSKGNLTIPQRYAYLIIETPGALPVTSGIQLVLTPDKAVALSSFSVKYSSSTTRCVVYTYALNDVYSAALNMQREENDRDREEAQRLNSFIQSLR